MPLLFKYSHEGMGIIMSYRITTDSTCDMPWEFYEEHDIAVIGMAYHIGDKECREGPDGLPSEEFYNQLRSGKQSATVQVNTYEFMSFVEPILEAGEDVLHIAFSSGLSGTYESCQRGVQELKEKYPDRTVVVVDSLCASMGEGLFLYYADRNRSAGLSLEENVKWLESHKLNLCHWFTVDDLMFLHRGGRVSKTSAVVGSLLGIKPVLHVDNDGHLILVSKARGRAGSIDALADMLKKTANEDIADQMVFVSHGDCQKEAEGLAEKLRQSVGIQKFMIHNIGAVIGSHSGPGTIAVFFMGRQR